jgi:hypothetical protein
MDRAIAGEFGFAITGTHSRGSSISTGSALYIADTGEFRVGRPGRRASTRNIRVAEKKYLWAIEISSLQSINPNRIGENLVI